jgi:hypothetical protein
MKRALVLVLVAACGKSSSSSSSSPKPAADERGKSPASGAVPEPAGPATPWKMDRGALRAKLQGVWQGKSISAIGDHEAWKIEGDQVTVYAGGKEETRTLSIDPPCQLTTTKKNADGSSEGGTDHFAFDGDALHLGLGDAAVKLADGSIVACISNGVYLFQNGACKFYTSMFDKWDDGEDATCSVTGDTFKASEKTFHGEGELKLTGAVGMDDQLRGNVTAKATDWAAAKAAVDAAK